MSFSMGSKTWILSIGAVILMVKNLIPLYNVSSD
jgi:hypothetical protein